MKFPNLQTTCECKTLILRGQRVVKCICGRDVHERCGEVIHGAYYGPDCRVQRLIGTVKAVVPGEL